MARKIAFLDRDGTLIEEPADFQIDSLSKFKLVPGVIPALLSLRDAGYEFVMVSNQDGLGTESFPTEQFEPPQNLLLEILESQGIRFSAIHIDPHFEHQQSPNRKPGIGMLLSYLRGGVMDFEKSVVIGDRATDLQLAQNLGIRGLRLGPDFMSWPEIVQVLTAGPRRAEVERKTAETRIRVSLDLDRVAKPEVATGLPFFDHMLEQIGKHGGFALTLICAGDTQVDEHHTVEDSALALGQALRQALGDKRGIQRYAFTLPMDESLAEAALDLSGRPYFVFNGQFTRERVGDLPTELVPHFFRSLCETLGANLHLSVKGENNHHMVEACFKVLARCLRDAIRREGNDLPSTKGSL